MGNIRLLLTALEELEMSAFDVRCVLKLKFQKQETKVNTLTRFDIELSF